MSETHTPEWTPEPWVAESCERHHYHSHNSLICFKLRDATGRAIGGASNIRRIVACINGCAGIDPAAVPDLIEYALLEAEYTRLCNRLSPDYDRNALMVWIDAHDMGNAPVGEWLGRKRNAALAKATGDRP